MYSYREIERFIILLKSTNVIKKKNYFFIISNIRFTVISIYFQCLCFENVFNVIIFANQHLYFQIIIYIYIHRKAMYFCFDIGSKQALS